jgi:hypothetical protein
MTDHADGLKTTSLNRDLRVIYVSPDSFGDMMMMPAGDNSRLIYQSCLWQTCQQIYLGRSRRNGRKK